jgi:hypothetical protein
MRNAIADLVISFAADGETDPKQLKTMTLAAVPRALQETDSAPGIRNANRGTGRPALESRSSSRVRLDRPNTALFRSWLQRAEGRFRQASMCFGRGVDAVPEQKAITRGQLLARR